MKQRNFIYEFVLETERNNGELGILFNIYGKAAVFSGSDEFLQSLVNANNVDPIGKNHHMNYWDLDIKELDPATITSEYGEVVVALEYWDRKSDSKYPYERGYIFKHPVR